MSSYEIFFTMKIKNKQAINNFNFRRDIKTKNRSKIFVKMKNFEFEEGEKAKVRNFQCIGSIQINEIVSFPLHQDKSKNKE